MAAVSGKVGQADTAGESPAWPALIGEALGGGVVGCVVGYMFLPHVMSFARVQPLAARLGYAIELTDMFWIPAATGAALGALAGAVHGVMKRASAVKRRAGFRDAAARLGGQVSTDFDPAMAERLKAFFPGSDHIAAQNVLRPRPAGGIALTVTDMQHTERAGNNKTRTVEQTVALFEQDQLRFPEFKLQPEGFLVNMLSRVTGIEDIDFSAYPQFSKAYHLSAAHPERTRKLFDGAPVELLGRRPGLCVESKGGALLLYRPGAMCDAEDLKHLIEAATEVFRALEQSARRSGMTPGAPPPPKQDVRRMVEKMPGLVGVMLRRDLVTREDADAFVRLAPPRKIPRNILAYRERMTPALFTLLGIVFAVAGAAFTAAFALAGEVIGALVGLLFLVIGATVAFYSTRARYRVKRLLRLGQLAPARIVKCEPTGASINNDEIFLATVQYRAGASAVDASCKIMGAGVERAKKLAAEGKPAAVLYDPAVPSRVLLVDALSSVSPEFEA
jgi:hypothetical protein